jgi:hypothetical protein
VDISASLTRFDDINAAGHLVVPQSAIFVADYAIGTCLGRCNGDYVLKARMNLDIHVDGQQ